MRSHFQIFRGAAILAIMLLSVTLPGFTQMKANPPSFWMTGAHCPFNVTDLPSDSPSLPFKLYINGTLATSGVYLINSIEGLKLPLSQTGNLDVILEIGKETSSHKIKVIPGYLTLLPPLIAILLALLTREVLSSLLFGVLVGAFLLNDYQLFIGFLRAIDEHILGALADSGHAAIVIFSVSLGGMVGILNRTGGMQGIVQLISKMVVGPRSAQLATWAMGVIIFFDDYANTLIVGNSMRPITDKNRVSREKLSYIVDSTAAPVAGIALISTWIGYEIGLIREQFIRLAIPETNFYGVFLETIPYRFYCILALFFGLLLCVGRREFGPMLHAERRARNEGKLLRDGANPISSPESAMPELPEGLPKRWYNAGIPIMIVILGTLVGIMGSGGLFLPHKNVVEVLKAEVEPADNFQIGSVQTDLRLALALDNQGKEVKLFFPETRLDNSGAQVPTGLEIPEEGETLRAKTGPDTAGSVLKLRSAFGAADSGKVLLWVSILGSIVALLLGLSQGLITLTQGTEAWVTGAKAMVMAMCVLLLAWAINSVCGNLHTGEYLVDQVSGYVVAWQLPTVIFIIACFVSFATGSSWGTMAIILPISIPLAYRLNLQHYHAEIAGTAGAPEAMIYAKSMLLVSIGAVLEGSIFGDHCSPISDTTIMSSMASGSDHIDHVRTQGPYALSVATVSILFCYIPAGMGVSPFILIPFGMAGLIGIYYIFGSKVSPDEDSVENSAQAKQGT